MQLVNLDRSLLIEADCMAKFQTKAKIMFKGYLWILSLMLALLSCFDIQSQNQCELTLDILQGHLKEGTCGRILHKLQKCGQLDDSRLMYHIGMCQYQADADSAALLSFQIALNKNFPRPGFVHMQLARCYARLQSDRAALVELQMAQSFSVALYPWFRDKDMMKMVNRNASVAKIYDEIKPSFDNWTVLFIPFILIGFLQVLVFRWWKKSFHWASGYLAALIFVFCLTMTSYVLFWTNYTYEFPYMGSWWHGLYYLIGPFYYLYVKGIFEPDDDRPNPTDLLHFIPFALMVLFLLPWHLRPFDIFLSWPAWMIFIGSYFVPKLVHLSFYFVLSLLHTKNDMQIDEHIRTWTRVVLVSFGLFLTANVVYFSLVRWSGFNVHWDYYISAVMCLSILSIGLVGMVQPQVFRSVPLAKALRPIKYKSSGLTPTASESLKKELEELMEVQQVYKESELRLNDLASYLQASKHHVSQIINEHYQVSFFEFVNHYRVRHVAKRLDDPKYEKETIIQLAYEAGFNNKVSFNKAFKQVYKMTPSAYRKSKLLERRQRKMEMEN
jgi:AraC-like DNA-binding protein